jgi:glycosyltransferase involved in cell wall biosynthesis
MSFQSFDQSLNVAPALSAAAPLPALARVAVVIPCYRVSRHILALLAAIGPEVSTIYVVDDCCPEGSADIVEHDCADPRVAVIRHEANRGVGGAMISGFRRALADGADIVVKLDGDGQMDPSLIQQFLGPILWGQADYVKGNRFFNIEDVKAMPKGRIFGNVALSFITKLSTGYWSLFDPNNGYVAIDARVLARLPLDKIAERYFFESDMLFRLNTCRARVIDLPMQAVYGDEASNLDPLRSIPTFLGRHIANLGKRIAYNYFLRDFSLATIELVFGAALLLFGLVFGTFTWIENGLADRITTTGTVMIAVLPIMTGLQLLLAFVGFDMANVPAEPIAPLLRKAGHRPAPFQPAGSGHK